jgi:hypothetical protein
VHLVGSRAVQARHGLSVARRTASYDKERDNLWPRLLLAKREEAEEEFSRVTQHAKARPRGTWCGRPRGLSVSGTRYMSRFRRGLVRMSHLYRFQFVVRRLAL